MMTPLDKTMDTMTPDLEFFGHSHKKESVLDGGKAVETNNFMKPIVLGKTAQLNNESFSGSQRIEVRICEIILTFLNA